MAEILLRLALNNNQSIKPNNVQHTGTGYRTNHTLAQVTGLTTHWHGLQD